MDEDEALLVLGDLLAKAARNLAGLAQPVVVAACPEKHDDTGRYPDWLGVQVGREIWERAEYRGDNSLFEENHVVERITDPIHLVAARSVLDDLQKANWRWLTDRAFYFGLFDEVLAVVVQHNAAWFLVSSSNAGQDIAFLIDSSGWLLKVGEADRLDERLGHARPMRLTRIDPRAWPALRAAVPAFPAEPMTPPLGTKAEAARARLVELLSGAFSKLRTLPGTLRYAASLGLDDYRSRGRGTRGREIALDGFHATGAPGSVMRTYWIGNKWSKEPGDSHGVSASLDHVLDELEAAYWRDLFSSGVMPLTEDESLALLVQGTECWLIVGGSIVFSPMPDGDLELVGASDDVDATRLVRRPAIHLFDGRSIVLAGPP